MSEKRKCVIEHAIRPRAARDLAGIPPSELLQNSNLSFRMYEIAPAQLATATGGRATDDGRPTTANNVAAGRVAVSASIVRRPSPVAGSSTDHMGAAKN